MSEPLLDDAGIDYTVAMSVPTTSGARSAIAAGLGVGVVGARYLDDEVVEWQPGASLGELPLVHQIARAVPGEQHDVAAALTSVLVAELREPVTAVA